MSEWIIRFGSFELRPERGQLLAGGVRVGIGSRAIAIVALLAERAGEIVSVRDITDHVWPNLFVQDNNLRVHMTAIRRALRAGGHAEAEIVNVPGRGYRLSAEVTITVAVEDAPEPMAFLDINPLPLPLQVNRLIGREQTIRDVVANLGRHPLVTIVGPGGSARRVRRSLR